MSPQYLLNHTILIYCNFEIKFQKILYNQIVYFTLCTTNEILRSVVITETDTNEFNLVAVTSQDVKSRCLLKMRSRNIIHAAIVTRCVHSCDTVSGGELNMLNNVN